MEPVNLLLILFKSVSVKRIAISQRLFFSLMLFVAVFFACSNRNILSKLEKCFCKCALATSLS